MLHMSVEEINTKAKENYSCIKFRFIFKKKIQKKDQIFFFFFERDEVNQLLISEWIRLPRECVWAENRVQGTITKNHLHLKHR